MAVIGRAAATLLPEPAVVLCEKAKTGIIKHINIYSLNFIIFSVPKAPSCCFIFFYQMFNLILLQADFVWG
jgi:hypothetical protein